MLSESCVLGVLVMERDPKLARVIHFSDIERLSEATPHETSG